VCVCVTAWSYEVECGLTVLKARDCKRVERYAEIKKRVQTHTQSEERDRERERQSTCSGVRITVGAMQMAHEAIPQTIQGGTVCYTHTHAAVRGHATNIATETGMLLCR
jgi:N-acetylglucosamine-6-phosphate deacetylase